MKVENRLVYAEEVEDLICGLDSLPWEEEVQTLVNSLTTVDAAEVVHAQWVLAEDGRLICSHCKSVKVAYEQLCYLRSTGCWNYCPNCGARMDA